MKKILNQLLQNHGLIYKLFLYILTVVLIVFLFPKGGKFKYEYFKGKPWQYENYYAPFNFAIQKTQEQIETEIIDIEQNSKLFFSYDESIVETVYENFHLEFENSLYSESIDSGVMKKGSKIIEKIYEFGFIDNQSEPKLNDYDVIITIRRGVVAH